jgi:glycosyltransferase involved in cell wall biosynthesis
MRRADGLLCDCRRDLRLAYAAGFPAGRPAAVLPGCGGVRLDLFRPGPPSDATLVLAAVPPRKPVIINPRGLRDYVRQDVFFRAACLLLDWRPDVSFVCLGMQHEPVAEAWADRLGIRHAVRLLPTVSREQMADLFRLAQVSVSPSVHDGTPNTLLEAMASGCFPVSGDIECVREWITHGTNGLLCDPSDPSSLARAMLRALGDAALRSRAAEVNLRLIRERAEYGTVRTAAQAFYASVAGAGQAPT